MTQAKLVQRAWLASYLCSELQKQKKDRIWVPNNTAGVVWAHLPRVRPSCCANRVVPIAQMTPVSLGRLPHVHPSCRMNHR